MSLFSQMRSQQLGTSTVDIGQAVRVGRRHRRIRGTVAVFGSAVLALVVLAGTGLALDRFRGQVTGPLGPAESAALPTPVTSTPTVFDPRTRVVDVAAPPGLFIWAISTGRLVQSITLARPVGAADGPASVTVSAFPAGQVPSAEAAWPPAGAERDGSGAYWAPGCGSDMPCDGRGLLAWEWADGAWATILVDLAPTSGDPEPSVADAYGLAKQVMASTAIGASVPVTVPVLAPVPPGWSLVTVIVKPDPSGAPRRADLVFSENERTVEGDGPAVVVSLRNDVTRDHVGSDTVDGRPATVEASEVTVFDVAAGWSLRVTAHPLGGNPLSTAADVLSYAESVTVVDDPNDTSTWVTPM